MYKIELDFNIPELERPLEGNYTLNQNILKHLFNNSSIDRRFNNYVKGKSVVVIASAGYLANQKKGEFFEDFDIIVRLGPGWKPLKESYEVMGKRTNIRWHSGHEFPTTGGLWEIDKMIDHGVEYACIQYPRYLDYFHHDIKKFEKQNEEYNMPFHIWSDLELYLSLHHYLGTRLNLGMAAVTDLLFYDISKLHMSGFTFYSGGKDDFNYKHGCKQKGYMLDDYIPEKSTMINHAQIPQMKLLRELQILDKRLSFDKETEDVLKIHNI